MSCDNSQEVADAAVNQWKPSHTQSDESVNAAMLENRYGPKVRPIAYACHLPRITARAREFGYAVAVHGSLQRDLDLIAVPWSEVAADPEQLVQAICETVGAFILPGQDATKKPHGRIAYVLQMGAGLYIDLSVMPRKTTTEEIRPKAAQPCGSREDYARDVRLAEVEYANNPSSKNLEDLHAAQKALQRHYPSRQ